MPSVSWRRCRAGDKCSIVSDMIRHSPTIEVLLGARWINRTALTARELFWALCMMCRGCSWLVRAVTGVAADVSVRSGLLLFALGDGLESARFTVLGQLAWILASLRVAHGDIVTQ